VSLNRGYSKPRKNGDTGIKDPDFYILPISYIQKVRDPDQQRRGYKTSGGTRKPVPLSKREASR
jgi:hypothetical protein